MDNDQGGREGGEGRVPRGLSLEQAQNIRRDRQLEDLTTRMDELMRMMQQGMHGNRRSQSPSPVHHPRHRQPPRDDDRGLRLDLPDFDGAMKPEKFLEWLQRMERVFDYKDYDDAKRFKVAILKLTGYASLWYENLKNKRRKDGKPSLHSWEKLKTRMKKRFLPSDFTQDMFRKLQVLQQNTLSVEEYVVEFEKINMLCDVDEKAEHKIARFIAGLDKKLAKKVDLQPYWSFEEVVQVAMRAEKYVKAKKASTFKPFVKQGEKPYSGAKKEEGMHLLLSLISLKG
ncbi:uncharacterized protein LOC130589887 [Beta vulgaris subsp. vulgaris]|uniref:uncharacterized protein LOC130589887 n=1 Tax=Beta vulgaris subsp. vulgaris TaxID=3555 RepID=UPI0025484830|nr:uncharacterized protein LOC130589887 [Beta vulgaris subsp. vulgaris]